MPAWAGLIGCLWASLWLGSIHPGQAVELPTNAISFFNCRTWSYEDGLPHNAVTSLTQTPDGYLWVGTQAGLARFDGVRFVGFNQTNVPALKDTWVYRVYTARDGSLWVSYESGTLLRYRDGVFTNLTAASGLSNSPVLCFRETGDGTLWMGTRRRLTRFRDGQFHPFAAGHPLADITAWSVFEDRSNTLWVACAPGLFCLKLSDPDAPASVSVPIPSIYLRSAIQDRQGTIYLGATEGFVVLKDGATRRYRRDEGLSHWYVNFVYEDRKGRIWIGSHGGLDRFEGGRVIREHDAFGNAFGVVNEIGEDREGNLWVASKEGLHRLRFNQFVTFSLEQGLSHNNVISVMEDRAGALWVGTWGGGLNVLRNGRFAMWTPASGSMSEMILALMEDRQGQVWCGTDYGEGVFRLRPDGGTDHWGQEQQLTDNAVRALCEDREGAVWIGARGGLNVWRTNKMSRLTTQDGLAGNIIRVLKEDRQGRLWIGTETGLTCRQHGAFTNYHKPHGLSHEFICALFEDAAGELWAGTRGGGINLFLDGRFHPCTTRQGLFHDDILEILEDDHGWMWMSTPHGVFRVSRQELRACCLGQAPAVRCVSYGKADGMASSACVGAARPSGWKSRDGRLWFATTKGLVTTSPKDVTVNEQIPPVIIEEAHADQQPLLRPGPPPRPAPAGGDLSLTVPPGRGELEIHYATLSFTAPEKNRFRYRLEGLSPDWIDAGGRRVAYYTNLKPGRYRFQVTGCNNDGVWNHRGASLTLILLPHFWQTWWFRTLAALLLLGGSAALARFLSVRRLQRQYERLERLQAIQNERSRIAQDMHDDLGARLTEILYLSDDAGQKPELGGMRAGVGRISATARELVRTLDAIVWAVNPENDTLEQSVHYIVSHAEMFLGMTPIRLRVDLPATLPARPLSSQVRHNLFLVAKEALHNVVKHSGATEVWLRLRLEGPRLELAIEDNGRGFDQDALPGDGNGLRNMRKRVQRLGGELDLVSRPGAGTRLRLSFSLEKPEARA